MEDIKLLNTIKNMLIEKALTLSVAESSTGGLLSDQLTFLPGASVYFRGGIVAYANDIKKTLLSVPEDILDEYGAVSQQTADEMARGVKERLHTDIGIGITGITGPQGESKEKPIGLTYISLADGGLQLVKEFRFQGTRQEIKHKSVHAALQLLSDYLLEPND